MLAPLLLVALSLAGLIVVTAFGDVSLDALQGWPIGATVIGALIVLYLATLRGGRGESRWGRPMAMAGLIVIAAFGLERLHDDPPAFVASLFSASETDAANNPFAPNAPAAVRVRRGADGGFLANSEVNGEALPMRIDSGAATVVLRQSDAEKAGIDIKSMTFDTPLKTANGTSYVAPVRLKSVRVGALNIDDVEALVAKPGTLNESLLGMSFLRRLASYEVTGDFATLRQ